MFDTPTGSETGPERPTLARSVWADLGGGVWRLNPALSWEPTPEIRHPEHARRRLAALTVREISPADAARVEDSLRA
ncbi:MAG: hypothetical protein L0I76_28530, partial [Pseudonocardia sp.]|nr:hypothetical protein [Pseudonocardia sp.]